MVEMWEMGVWLERAYLWTEHHCGAVLQLVGFFQVKVGVGSSLRGGALDHTHARCHVLLHRALASGPSPVNRGRFCG